MAFILAALLIVIMLGFAVRIGETVAAPRRRWYSPSGPRRRWYYW